ncbi:hypothetical protein JQ633_32115, partial [Bradyrhizobium tropiciagri]|nr:hypothetical protein [Bradyrhizobium tropiciagri]
CLQACADQRTDTVRNRLESTFRHYGQQLEKKMPVLILWAVPAVLVVGGVGYFLVHMQ